MLLRRTVLLAPLAAAVPPASAATPKMTLSMHQNTSRAAGYRKSLEGWAKAGIKNVEVTDNMLDAFLKDDTIEAAKKIISDNGLKLVSCAAVLPDMFLPRDTRMKSLETWKKRCDQFAALGVDRAYCPSVTSGKVTAEDYKGAPDCIREFGDVAKARNLIGMIEFARTSTLIATLTTSLKLIREAAHPNVKQLFDCYHFYSFMGKLEDLDTIKTGEIGHVHFQDVPDIPRELLDSNTRGIPGTGISPLTTILSKLSSKGYAGPLSVELFAPEFTNGDPQEVATKIKASSEEVMKKAKVL